MQFYRMYNPDGKWQKITEADFVKAVNSHFEEAEVKSWDGSIKPSRQAVIEHVKSGKVLHLYTANYKAEANNELD